MYQNHSRLYLLELHLTSEQATVIKQTQENNRSNVHLFDNKHNLKCCLKPQGQCSITLLSFREVSSLLSQGQMSEPFTN